MILQLLLKYQRILVTALTTLCSRMRQRDRCCSRGSLRIPEYCRQVCGKEQKMKPIELLSQPTGLRREPAQEQEAYGSSVRVPGHVVIKSWKLVCRGVLRGYRFTTPSSVPQLEAGNERHSDVPNTHENRWRVGKGTQRERANEERGVLVDENIAVDMNAEPSQWMIALESDMTEPLGTHGTAAD
ncbi:hypothetical protein MG293_010288 [Ovis ammon polii]|uniref:Uncharacterized protein n=1 Tax=Ovis ammon polii TaxID=230172 RepID=A0AAD4Y9S4_OVIAM|nr:hypothetical protein MG293_010288 [Ovis ammon polii]